jgi:hypothetical protein
VVERMASSAGSGPLSPLDSPGNEPGSVSGHGLLTTEVLETGFGGGTPDRQQGEGETSSNHQGDNVRAEGASGEDQPQFDPGEDQKAKAHEPGNYSEKQQAAPHEVIDPSNRRARKGILGLRWLRGLVHRPNLGQAP